MTEYRHTEDMEEISGFGGGYEKACQDMLEAGMKFMIEKGFQPGDVKVLANENIYGLCFPDNRPTEELEKAVEAADENCSGAMHHAVMSRLAWISKNGWEAYCAEARRRKKEGSK